MGGYSNIAPWVKVGYNPTVTTTEESVWSYGGEYTFPTVADTMNLSSDNAAVGADTDIGVALHSGGATDAGGSPTTIVVSTENFSTNTAIGDIIIIDKAGTTPEWGVITEVTGNTTLTFAGGLSSGGTGASRATYHVLDVSAAIGAMAVIVEYLDSTYARKYEIMILNATLGNNTTSVGAMYRINGMMLIAVGTKTGGTPAAPTNACIGNLSLHNDAAATPVYTYITAGYTRARNSSYTVPLGKTLYVNEVTVGWADDAETKILTARFIVESNQETTTNFINGLCFYGYGETLVTNGTVTLPRPIPQKFVQKADIKICCQAYSGSGPALSIMRGFLVT